MERMMMVWGALLSRVLAVMIVVATIGFLEVAARAGGTRLHEPDEVVVAPGSAPAATSDATAVQGVTLPPRSDWYMAGANPERTSWVSDEVRGRLGVEWYRPIEPYIPYKVQPIATNGKIYVATARGLYAINAASGSIDFVYPTAMPIGNAPTVVTVNGTETAYFGGFDNLLHAIDANTGTPTPGFTPFRAAAGFEANPLVINDTVYLGSRDGFFYAIDAVSGALRWRFKASAPVVVSAAYKNNVIYFGSIDSYAYALNAATGAVIWRSQRFHGVGFYTWWPVVYTNRSTGRDYVVFTSGENYSSRYLKLIYDSATSESQLIFNSLPENTTVGPTSTSVSGDWVNGTTVIDLAGWPNRPGVMSYLEERPSRHFVFVLDAANGQEFTFDSDRNGRVEYAPFLWSGVTHSGSKFPPVVNGVDGVMYQQAAYMAWGWISRGAVVGWKFGTPYVSQVARETYASDEPTVFSSGGRLVYTSLCCERSASGVDVTIPLISQTAREWSYYSYNLFSQAPDFRLMYNDGIPANYTNVDGWQLYSGRYMSRNGIYSNHMNSQSPAIPYRGKLYFLKGNALIAFSAKPSRTELPLAESPATSWVPPMASTERLLARLQEEVQAMLSAGHLRPGYDTAGLLDQHGFEEAVSADTALGPILEYFRNPADTVTTLLRALPYLNARLRTDVRRYLEVNYGPGRTYDFARFTHSGYAGGASREYALTPTDETPLGPAQPGGYDLTYNFYAAWKYAVEFGNARAIFDGMNSRIGPPPSGLTQFIRKPYMLNQYLAGYIGYLELQRLAGYAPNATVQEWYSTVLNARIANFSKDTPYWGQGLCSSCGGVNYNRAFAIARNFMFLTPEVATLLRRDLSTQVRAAVNEYQYVAPYWFVSKFDGATGENAFQHLYDRPALLQAKAYILEESSAGLNKFLDIPSFARGDLFYIQNLIAVLSRSATGLAAAPANLRNIP